MPFERVKSVLHPLRPTPTACCTGPLARSLSGQPTGQSSVKWWGDDDAIASVRARSRRQRFGAVDPAARSSAVGGLPPQIANRHLARARGLWVVVREAVAGVDSGRASAGSASLVVVSVSVQSFLGRRSSVVDVAGHKGTPRVPGFGRAGPTEGHEAPAAYFHAVPAGSTVTWYGSPPGGESSSRDPSLIDLEDEVDHLFPRSSGGFWSQPSIAICMSKLFWCGDRIAADVPLLAIVPSLRASRQAPPGGAGCREN